MTDPSQLIFEFTPDHSEVSLVNCTDEDVPFLQQVYVQSRWEELAVVTYWTDEQKLSFLSEQFAAQKMHYDTHYKGARFCMIRIQDAPAGRLYLYSMPSEIRIVDIALLTQYQRKGYGAAILGSLVKVCHAAGADLTIHVEINNPAMSLYHRLGFVAEGQPNGVYMFMRKKSVN